MTGEMAVNISPPKVLIVDDDAVTRRLITGALQARGNFETVEVESLADATAALAAETFCAAILDLRLPDGNGMEFVHMVRRGLASRSRDMVIVVSSAFVSARTSRLLLRLGATEVMGKPPDISRIAALLQQSDAA